MSNVDPRHRAVKRLEGLLRDRAKRARVLRRRGVEPPQWLVESLERHASELHRLVRRPPPWPDPGHRVGGKPLPARMLTFGTVVFAHVPFTGGDAGSKWRPAVVVAVARRSLTVCPITSSTSVMRPVGVYPRLVCWQADGLIKPSYLKPDPVTIGRLDLSHVLGHLQHTDRDMFGWLELPGTPHPTALLPRAA